MPGPARVRRNLRAAAAVLDLGPELGELRADMVAVRCLLLGMQTFELGGASYQYLAREGTFRHERAVEVPIAHRAVAQAGGGAVLEVGNVLRHHYPGLAHRVVDKHERATGVENIDVFAVSGSYDLVVSVSTLEHVGYDEPGVERGGGQAVEAIAHLRGCLAPGGRLLFTSPLGYNPALDAALAAGIPGVETRYLRRVDVANRWEEASWAEVAGTSYGRPYRNANAIVVGSASA